MFLLLFFRWSVEEDEVGGLMIGMVAIAMATNSFSCFCSLVFICKKYPCRLLVTGAVRGSLSCLFCRVSALSCLLQCFCCFSGEGAQEVWNERIEMDVDIKCRRGKGCLFVWLVECGEEERRGGRVSVCA